MAGLLRAGPWTIETGAETELNRRFQKPGDQLHTLQFSESQTGNVFRGSRCYRLPELPLSKYGLITALIAVAAVTVLGTVGTNLNATFSTVANKL